MGHAHAGMSPTEARRLARQIDARAEKEERERWAEYATEARACGYEVTPFAEWSGRGPSAKAQASARMAETPWHMLDQY
ncbi:hypothetical protein LCM08_06290 [Salipiger pacificus]|nr:hypothetical protein [Alloyangia pacifica]